MAPRRRSAVVRLGAPVDAVRFPAGALATTIPLADQELAELLRDRSVSLVEVAFLLGFADQSTFTHAFRRWTGRAPAAYRRSISPVRR